MAHRVRRARGQRFHSALRDPGETFPWDRLAAAGIGHFVPPAHLRDGRFFAQGDAGQPVEVTVSAYPGQAFPGVVQSMAGGVDEKTRTLPVRCLDGVTRSSGCRCGISLTSEGSLTLIV